MPQSTRESAPSSNTKTIRQADGDYDKIVLFNKIALFNEKMISELPRDMGVFDALRALNTSRKTLKKAHTRHSGMSDVYDGVIEEFPSGRCEAAFQTSNGPRLVRGESISPDPQWSGTDAERPAHTDLSDPGAAGELVIQLATAGENTPAQLLCAIELTRFTSTERDNLLPLLWQYILDHRDSNNCEELVGVAAAIRKYIAIMPMERMGELAILLEAGHRSPLPVELEIEVAKMIYRNFEVHPPVVPNPYPELAQRLLDMVEAYLNPRIFLRDKHPAVASLAIMAIVAMRSPLAEIAWKKAETCSYRWFSELVSDDIDELQEKWHGKSIDAANWLQELRKDVLAAV